MWTARAAAIVVPVDVLQLPPAVSSGCWARASASRTKRSSEPGTASCPRAKQRELPLLGIQTHQRAHHRLQQRIWYVASPASSVPLLIHAGEHFFRKASSRCASAICSARAIIVVCLSGKGSALSSAPRCRYRPWHHRPAAVRWLYHVRPHTLPCAVATITAPRAVVSTTSSCLCTTRQWGQGPDAGHDSEMTIGAVDLRDVD
jgi:hypothetical protein